LNWVKPFKKEYLILFLCTHIFLISCSNSPRYSHHKKKPRIGKTKSFNKHQKIIYGISSYYGKDFHGKLTANGEVYDMYGLTAAHKTFPLNTIIRVTNQSNDKSLILRVNDRGPYVGNRILDCSYGAALKLDFIQQGTAEVKIEVIEWGDDKYMKHK
jgi:rare lipoprotein A